MNLDIQNEILSKLIIHMKYAKYIEKKKRRELWPEIILRNKNMHVKKFPSLKKEINEAYEFVYSKKILPSMRSLQFAGKPVEINPTRIFNCAYLPIDSIYAFSETMFLLLGGTGVGFSVQSHHIKQLPIIKKPLERKKRFLIGDSIEGWADAIKILLEAYFLNKSTPTFDYSDIRPKGQKLITSGGKAPGPEPLVACIKKITEVLESKKIGTKLTTLECYDIQCYIADAVLTGGIRRAALISLFSLNDDIMIQAKSNFKVLEWNYVYSEGPLNTGGEKVTGVKQIHIDQAGNTFYDLKIVVEEPGYGESTKIIQWVSEDHIEKYLKEGVLPWFYFQPQRGRSNNSAAILRHKIKKPQFNKLWDTIRKSESGEPGIYFTNDKDWGCNPCFSGDTLISMADGRDPIPISELAEYSQNLLKFQVYSAKPYCSSNQYGESTKFRGGKTEVKNAVAFITGYKPTIEIVLSNGDKFKCTESHKLALQDGSYIRAVDSKDKYLEKFFTFNEVGKQNNTYINEYPSENNHDYSHLSEDIYVVSINQTGNHEPVYDLTVDDNHNFYITTSIDNNKNQQGILVHNCVEIALRPNQFCNLVDVNVSDIKTQGELNARCRAAAFIATLQASYTDFHYLRDIWKETTENEALIGVGHTGIASNALKDLNLEEAAEVVNEENGYAAALMGINKAERTTTVKPAGTSSLVLGCSSGIHAWHSKYYVRRIRLSKSDVLYEYLSRNHPKLVVDDHYNPEFEAIIEIPQKAPKGAIIRSENVIDLLERSKRWNLEWIKPGHHDGQNSHNVSCTVSIKEDEWDLVGNWFWDNRSTFNGMSVLPFDGGNYVQAPFESISKQRYEDMILSLNDIDLSKVKEEDDNTDLAGELACSGGSCEIK